MDQLPVPPPDLVARIGGDLGDRRKLLWTFERYARLTPEEDVLDAGCGVGKAALALAGWLTGRYEGFDVDARLIRWCQENLTPAYANFGFTHVDVFNAHYNPSGIPASEFTFPYEDESFDLALGLSLFTHLLPTDLEAYLSETRRVLRQHGRALFTFFLLRPGIRETLARGGWVANRLLERDQGDYSTVYDKAEELVAYRQGYAREAFERRGFAITEFFWGDWPEWATGRSASYTQDVLVAEARP